MSQKVEPIIRRVFDADQLMARHPPVWEHPNKQTVFDVSSPRGSLHEGTLVFSRWSPMPLPDWTEPTNSIQLVEGREGHYDYVSLHAIRSGVEWHVNFADPYLFVYYGSSLFAQDELQVAEHPALGALREALDAQGIQAVTVEDGRGTPVLVAGVERRCQIATDRNVAEGRPNGLYGNAFASADVNAVWEATTRIDPPTTTNLIAIAAPVGEDKYQSSEVRYVLDTAFTGFRAAVEESARLNGGRCPVVVHSGFWGCGAFGGNRVLMAILQMIAAEMAGLERLVMHTSDRAGTRALDEAIDVIRAELGTGSPVQTDALIDSIVGLGFEWGIGDGN